MSKGKMKVIFSITTLTGGGAERVVSVWANFLAQQGFDSRIMLCGRTENEYPVDDNVKILTVSNTYGDYEKLSAFKKFKKKRAILKSEDADYIISFLSQNRIWTYLCAFGLRAKRIETVRNSPWHTDMPSGLLGRLTKHIFRKSYRVILQSSDQAAYFGEKVRNKSEVIPNPVSPIYYESFKTEFADKVEVFIAAGRLTEQKNYFAMVEAFEKAHLVYPEIILKIFGAEDAMGEGNGRTYADRLRSLIAEKGLSDSVFLMGRSSYIENEYKKADAFLISSNYEGMPNALGEAMASKLVCVSTDCKTGPRDLIDDSENGFLVSVGDTDAFANAIIKVCNMDMESRIKMGACAREKIMSYCSKENSVKRLAELLSERQA